MDVKSAISAVNAAGVLLVYPINNTKEPKSLWYHYFPRTKMKWEWDDESDNRVADLWYLRERLSSSGKVVYSKWFRGKATLISKELLPALLKLLNPSMEKIPQDLSREAAEVLEILLDNSPLSTKQLKELTGLQGKYLETDYVRRLRELWSRLLIVSSGEIDDGAFPSLAISATALFFEEEWNAALELTDNEALQVAVKILGKDSPFFRFLIKNRKTN